MYEKHNLHSCDCCVAIVVCVSLGVKRTTDRCACGVVYSSLTAHIKQCAVLCADYLSAVLQSHYVISTQICYAIFAIWVENGFPENIEWFLYTFGSK